MPRKYHRPPDTTTKRRKTRKAPIPYEFEAPPVDTTVAEEAVFEAEKELPLRSPEPARATSGSSVAGKGERHVTVDYGYVRGDVIRIAAIMGFLVISLIITSIFR